MRQEDGRSTPIDSVVFDIGRVLVRLEFTRFLRFLAQHGVDTASVDRMLERIDLTGYERGDFGGEELLRRIVALGDPGMSVEDLRCHWLGIFEPEKAMIELARQVARQHRVFLLSNIGDLHWDFLDRETEITQIGHGALPSFRAGAAKPDAAIYSRAEDLFGLEPARTVFVDDLWPNVEAARRRGWHGIRHVDHATTCRELRGLGIAT